MRGTCRSFRQQSKAEAIILVVAFYTYYTYGWSVILMGPQTDSICFAFLEFFRAKYIIDVGYNKIRCI